MPRIEASLAATHFPGSITESALELILESGYSAMSMRCLARKLGIQPGSIYHHFQSKADVLEQVIDALVQRRMDGWLRVKPQRSDPISALKTFIAFHVQHQVDHGRVDLLIMSELRHLGDDRREEILINDGNYVAELHRIIGRGAESKVFKVLDVHIASMSVLALLNGTCGLIDKEKPMSVRFLVQLMTHMSLKLVGTSLTL